MEYIQNIINGLENDLNNIGNEEENMLKTAEKSIYRAKEYLRQTREYILKYTFPTVEEEIMFFKELKPRITSQLIYFVKVFNIESKMPTGSLDTRRRYLTNELDRLSKFFNENLEFYQYYRAKSTFLDEKYFARGRQDIRLYMENVYAFSDEDFCTSHDLTVAKIMANDRLEVYLQTELDKLENRVPMIDSPPTFHLKWTDSKISLVELIYALVQTGCLNDGKTDIKELASFFEYNFRVDLHEVYRIFYEIRDRTNKTKFLDTLRQNLLLAMHEKDK